ncbi:hypothetical protein PNOK_0778000 [Pyrrhoderma noxium]|uniref:Threonine/serine exporter-like N-terminal domain-containing protein n=1 Tax=Pyrrhoderma noxium TaxID=2282107 RepID=A0A286U9B7_9AGAM|nr:hypothetical protein PNOK_0778000 [Pyrrhoderma noxium]
MSFLICGFAFGGSLNDMWVAGLMGLLVRLLQSAAEGSQLSASGAQVFTSALVSFIAQLLSSFTSRIWCFTSISSSGVISLLPGFVILMGQLDVSGGNLALGTPKVIMGVLTSLFLGFGLTLGSDVFLRLDPSARRELDKIVSEAANNTVNGFFEATNSTSNVTFVGSFTFSNETDVTMPNIVQGCYRDESWGWYLQPLPPWVSYLLVPFFVLASAMANQQHWKSRQMLVIMVIACASFSVARLCNTYLGLKNHPDYVALIGSLVASILGNSYARLFGGTAYTVMLSGILLLVPVRWFVRCRWIGFF